MSKPARNLPDYNKEAVSVPKIIYEFERDRLKGLSVQDIYKKYNGEYSIEYITDSLNKMLHINEHLSVKDGNLIRQKALDELDSYMRGLYEECWWKYEKRTLTKEFIPLALNIFDRKVALLNITPPKQMDITIRSTINAANERLDEQINRFSTNIISMNKVDDVYVEEK